MKSINKISLIKILIIVLIALPINIYQSFSQSGISFAEFSKRLENYFDKDMIMDLQKSIPNIDKCTIWGWDVGDFSGDGNNDVAFTIKINAEKKSKVYLNLFVDIDGYFVKVGEFPYNYIDLPLEVGATIKNGVCYVAQKLGASNWKMNGFQVFNGSLIFKEDFYSRKFEYFTVDNSVDYFTLQNTEKVFENTKGTEKYLRKYFVIPSYNRGRLIFNGFNNTVKVDDVDFVNKGAFYWNGPKDCYFEATSAYDEEYLYFQVKVYDDIVTNKTCNNCFGDYVSIWFDAQYAGDTIDHFHINEKDLIVNNKPSNGVYNFQIFPGDFIDIPPFVNAYSNDLVTSLQQISASHIKVSSNKFDGGYVVKIRIPYDILDIDPTNFTNSFYNISCSIEVHDIDNEFRPEEETIIATSQFDQTNPSTYGKLLFIPNNNWYGLCKNIYKQDILQTLLEFGY
jgi:hypothetical protein